MNAAGQATGNFEYTLFIFDIRYQKNFFSAQPRPPKKLSFKFVGILPAGVGAYARAITNKLNSSSDVGLRPFEPSSKKLQL